MIWVNNMKLYEISNELQNVFENISEDGDVTQDQLDLIDNLNQSFEEKAVSVAAYIKNLEAESKMIDEAVIEMTKRRRRIDRNAEDLVDYLRCHLIQNSINEIKTSPYFKIKLKKCPPSVEVFNEEEIPAEYWHERVTKVLSKRNLLDDLKEGQEIPGAYIKNNIKLEIK